MCVRVCVCVGGGGGGVMHTPTVVQYCSRLFLPGKFWEVRLLMGVSEPGKDYLFYRISEEDGTHHVNYILPNSWQRLPVLRYLWQIEEMRTSEVEQVRQEKDAKISELSQLLDRMRAELFELEFMQSGRLAGVENDSFASLPPNAFSSKGDTQRENSPAILPVAESQPKHSASDSLVRL